MSHIQKTSIKQIKQADVLKVRILILIGFYFLFNFYIWLTKSFVSDYWFLSILVWISFLYKTLQILHQWVHYFFVSTPKIKEKIPKNLSVDVFTTFVSGEPIDLVKETLLKIKNMEYPHKTYLCSEGYNEELSTFCKINSIEFVWRDEHSNAKAGNINNALKTSTADIVVIFDPDHQPHPDFLKTVLPYFDDEKIGIVQTVQGYRNKNTNLVTKGAVEETYHFYGPLMMGMNTFGTVQAIGANSVFRRSALDSIGGHAPGLTEDMHTSMKLHANGWKSVYVPVIINRGFVPFDLKGYLHQQFKWTNGAFDLFLNVYPNLFSKFSWKQKLHYATLPLYFAKGLITAIDILIPVICLLFSISPIETEPDSLINAILPLLLFIFSIRVFAQKWFHEPIERGPNFSAVIMNFATWRVNIKGIVYAIIKIKVPYIPTRKNKSINAGLKDKIPDMIILFVLFLSIVFGLYRDLTYYSIIFAILIFIQFCILIAVQFSDKIYINFSYSIFWNLIRKSIFLVSMCFLPIYFIFNNNLNSIDEYTLTPKKDIEKINNRYFGVYLNNINEQKVDSILKIKQINAVSFYSSLILKTEDFQKYALIQKLIKNGITIIWTIEPWQELNSKNHVMIDILNGNYDTSIENLSNIVSFFNTPVFIRFAQEPDNPYFPWYSTNQDLYINSFRYIHQYFNKKGIQNVAWIYTPWSPDNVERYYPGNAFVDWVGLDILNYDEINKPKSSNFFDLYEAFRYKILQYEKPIMLSEFGAYKNEHQNVFVNQMLESIKKDFDEIKAVVFFNSNNDTNTLNNVSLSYNWEINENIWTKILSNSIFIEKNNKRFKQILPLRNFNSISKNKLNIKSICYNTSNDWKDGFSPLTRKMLELDFDRIKEIGANTILTYKSSIYDYNILTIAEEKDLEVIIGINLPYNNTYEKIEELQKSILKQVDFYCRYNSFKGIVLGNEVWGNLNMNYHKPELIQVRRNYLNFCNNLSNEILKKHPDILISIQESMHGEFVGFLKDFEKFSPNIPLLGINAYHTNNLIKLDSIINKQLLNRLYWISEFGNPNYYNKKTVSKENLIYSRELYSRDFFIEELSYEEKIDNILLQKSLIDKLKNCSGLSYFCWKDQMLPTLTWSGITDFKNRIKPEYYALKYIYNNETSNKNLIENLNITCNDSVFFENKNYTFYAVLNQEINFEDIKIQWVISNEDGVPLKEYHVKQALKKNEITIHIPEKFRKNMLLTCYIIHNEHVYYANKFIPVESVFYP